MFTHFSVQVVPVKFLKQFRQYIKRLLELGLIAKFSIIPTGEYVPNFPNFDYYNPLNSEWTFQWEHWLNALNKAPTLEIEDPASYDIHADKKDILIVRELEKDGRKSFAELAPLLGISLQGVKYHYDKKLVPAGIVKYFALDLLPYPEEISARHEILVNFKSTREMNRFYSLMKELFFVLGVSKVLHQHALLVRTYILQTQVQSLFAFLSAMAQEGHVESYSAIRKTFIARYPEAISYELYDRETGWNFDLKKYMVELSKVARNRTVRARG
jgi:DNA-binding Lrp family transcriptional regulator